MSKGLKRVRREAWGAYYSTPVEDGGKIWGVHPLHQYHCGTFERDGVSRDLLYIIMMKDVLEDTQGLTQESFDLSPIDADEIAMHPLYQLVAAGGTLEPVESVFSVFKASVAQLIWKDMQDGMNPYEIFEKRVGILVTQFEDFKFQDLEIPIVSTDLIDAEGNSYSVDNIHRCSLEDKL